MACKINHSDPECIPQFLCCACHPELVPTPEERAEELERLKAVVSAEATERQRKQEIMRTAARLQALERRHHGDIGGIDAKVAASLRTKLEKLERGEVVAPRKRRRKRK